MTPLPSQSGFIALLTVILVGSFLAVASFSLAMMHSDELLAANSWLSVATSHGRRNACVDNALALLRNNTNLSGNVNITATSTPCIATISGSGNTRTIIARATTTDAYSRNAPEAVNVNVNVNTNPFTIMQYKDILD